MPRLSLQFLRKTSGVWQCRRVGSRNKQELKQKIEETLQNILPTQIRLYIQSVPKVYVHVKKFRFLGIVKKKVLTK